MCTNSLLYQSMAILPPIVDDLANGALSFR